MIAYGETGADFIQRASAYAPTLPADLETVCRVWAAADYLDRDIGEALIEFDSALFDGKGELFTTRGVEPGAADDGEETLTYHCDWTLERPDGGWVSVRLSCQRPPAEMSLEVADSTRAVRSVGSAASQPFHKNQRPY